MEDFKANTDLATLTSILTYHVLPGIVPSSAIRDGLSVATVQGENVTFSTPTSGPMINDANIIAADIETSNGMIHVLDSMLMPSGGGVPSEADVEIARSP